MYEGLNHGDGSMDEDHFEELDLTVLGGQLPIKFNGLDFTLTPDNTKLRLFGEGALEYSRALVDVGDGGWVEVKLDHEMLNAMSESGFPTTRPAQPDDSDVSFLAGYIASQTSDLAALPEFG